MCRICGWLGPERDWLSRMSAREGLDSLPTPPLRYASSEVQSDTKGRSVSATSEVGSGQERDSADLAKFGYNQELKRSLVTFSSFAVAFSYISPSKIGRASCRERV